MIIPLFTDTTHYSVDVRLDGVLYTLNLDWIERTSGWVLSVYQNDTPISAGVPCVANTPLMAGVWEGWTGGQFVVVGDRDPGRYDWGTRARLLYVSAAEVAAL